MLRDKKIISIIAVQEITKRNIVSNEYSEQRNKEKARLLRFIPTFRGSVCGFLQNKAGVRAPFLKFVLIFFTIMQETVKNVEGVNNSNSSNTSAQRKREQSENLLKTVQELFEWNDADRIRETLWNMMYNTVLNEDFQYYSFSEKDSVIYSYKRLTDFIGSLEKIVKP